MANSEIGIGIIVSTFVDLIIIIFSELEFDIFIKIENLYQTKRTIFLVNTILIYRTLDFENWVNESIISEKKRVMVPLDRVPRWLAHQTSSGRHF